MNFLAGVQRLARECHATAPSTVVSQSGEARRFVDWYNAAWMDIQGLYQDWEWLRTSTSFVTVAGQAAYTTAECNTTDFGMWDKYSFRNYLTATGNSVEVFMDYMDYEAWRDLYQFSTARTSQSQPYEFTITPAKSIGLGPVPLVGYTVTGDYFKCPTELAADDDIPALPTHFHMAIVYRAMMMYGTFSGSIELYQQGKNEFTILMARIIKDRLPEISFA